MRKESQDKLYKDFPNLFSNEKFDGFWCPDGWFDLIYDLSKEINNIRISIISKLGTDYQVIQVKDKFSGLRYYMSSSTPEMNELITIAEIKSYDLCGSCGNHRGPRNPNESLWKENYCETCTVIKNIIE